jgi:hypothetical protein
MSWTMTIPKTKGTEFLAAVNAADPIGQDEPDVLAERNRQVLTAKEAIRAIIFARALGYEAEVSFSANVYGHANPECKPREGWANDTLTITVSQAT